MAQAPVTLLFTDLANSTELLHRVGDEQAQRVLRAHRQLLRDALASHGGGEVKWLGDGLMTTFPSVADAVRCAIAMQQHARRPAAGERLGLRIGLHVGEVLPDEGDYIGTPVVLARRLCDEATAGQILCSAIVVELLRGRQAFRFAAVGARALKGFADPVPAYEVAYEPEDAAARLGQTPFTGRTAELARLTHRLEDARGARGGVVLVMGEPGIGKTRALEEFAERVRAQGTLVLWGRCYEGEAGRPYGPFAEAIGEYARTAAVEALEADLGLGAAPLGRLVPVVRERLPDLPEPVALEPYEERVRLLDAVTQFLLALAARVATVLVLDDLHWADAGTVALLRHVARFAPRGRLLVLGAYRDVEVDRQHPLAEALGTLPRETRYEHVGLAGLDRPAVQALLDAIAEAEVEPGWPRPWRARPAGTRSSSARCCCTCWRKGRSRPTAGSGGRRCRLGRGRCPRPCGR
jgi:class 3 adenylate cyclase